MTNRIIKKSHFAKSKIFITFLCIFGLAFSYGCRKSGGGGVVITDPTVITPSFNAGSLLVVDTKNSKIKQSLSITFDNVNAKLDSVTVDGIADLSTSDFEYDGSALKLNGNFNKITEEKKKITAVFTLTPKNSGETLTKTTETVEAQIVAVKELTGSDLGNQLKNMSMIMPNVYYTFPPSSPDTASDTEFKIVNNSSKTKESPTTKLSVADFVVELKNTLNKYITNHETDAYFTGYTLNEVPKINNTIAEFTITFNIKVEYEFSGEYKITVDAKSSDDNASGSWEQQ